VRVSCIAIACLIVTGCGKSAPTLAGGKTVDHWVKALSDADAKTRKDAAFKLGNVGPPDPSAFPALLGALKDSDATVRCEVILALMKFGPKAKEAMPTLTDLKQNDADPRVRDYASRAIESLSR
jgi:HEAT repeat protein